MMTMAMAMAMAMAMEEKPVYSGQYLIFRVERITFGMNILQIKVVEEPTAITTIPMAPTCIRGVINHRGVIISVIDLSFLFMGKKTVPAEQARIILLDIEFEGEKSEIGLLVEEVRGVIELDGGELDEPPAFGLPVAAEFVRGVGRFRGDVITVLDGCKFTDPTVILETS